MDPVQYFSKMNLGRIEEHHHSTRCADFIGKGKRKATLRQGNPGFQTGNSTGRKIKLGQDITELSVRLRVKDECETYLSSCRQVQ